MKGGPLPNSFSMQTMIPGWGFRGCPLLPGSLRALWSAEPVPAWVAHELGLSLDATFCALGVDAWAGCTDKELPESVRKFLTNIVAMRRASIGHLRVFDQPWPRSLEPAMLSWSARTNNCLRKAELLSDVSRLSAVTFSDLFSIPAMGAISILEFACVAEAAFRPSQEIMAGLEDLREPSASRLFEAIGADWAPQVSNQDPRFSDLLPPGNLTVFEMLEKITAEPEDPPLAEIQLARSIDTLSKRLVEIGRAPLEVALADFIEKVTAKGGIRHAALLRRLGSDGEPPATLEAAASVVGFTRERMRQIHKRFSDRLPNHPIFMPQLDAAISAVRNAAPISVDLASQLVRQRGISARNFHPSSLLTAAEFCGRSQPFEIDSSVGLPRVIVEQSREFERIALVTAYRQAQASGATNIQEVVAELASKKQTGASDESVRRFLKACREIEFLGEDWFWHKSAIPGRNRLRNLTRKMLSVMSPIPVGELREGVHRSYKMRRTRGLSTWPLVTPPRAVLQEFYRFHPEFSIDGSGLVASVEKLEYGSELNSIERIFVDILRSSPACLLDRGTLARICSEMGINPNTFSQYLSSSPVIAHVGVDMWSLRGTRVDPTAVEALRVANAARPREKRIIDHGWTEGGDLWLAARLPEFISNFVLGVPSTIRRYVSGREFPATDELGLPAGTIHVTDDGTSYGYAPFLTRRGADADDILMVSFKLTKGTSTVRLIDDEELEAISPNA